MTVYSKFNEKNAVQFDANVTTADKYGAFNGTDAPTKPTFLTAAFVMQDLAASYVATPTTKAIPIVGTAYPRGTPLEVRAHRGGGAESWTDLTSIGDGRTYNTTLAVGINTGWAIEIRVKTTQTTIFTSGSFAVTAP